jgi:bifunctional non-homologous end joining protein LigD
MGSLSRLLSDGHQRKTQLARLFARQHAGIHVADFERSEIGPELFRHACLMGLEGIVSKHRDSSYRAGRQRHWIKIKSQNHAATTRVVEALS